MSYKTYKVDFLLDDVQLSRANTEFNVRGLKKIEVDTAGRWHLYHKERNVKGLVHFCQYWNDSSLVDTCRKEYILTGKRRYFEWIGQSYVEKTDDKEWVKTHQPVVGDAPEKIYYEDASTHPVKEGLGGIDPKELKINNTEDTKPLVKDEEE